MCQDHRRNDKLAPKFKGPYEIVGLLDNDRFQLQGRDRIRGRAMITIAKEKLRYWPGEWIEENAPIEYSITNS